MSNDNSNVVFLDMQTTQDIPVERILDAAKHLKKCVVLGWEEDGTFYVASSSADAKDRLWMLEQAIETLKAKWMRPKP